MIKEVTNNSDEIFNKKYDAFLKETKLKVSSIDTSNATCIFSDEEVEILKLLTIK